MLKIPRVYTGVHPGIWKLLKILIIRTIKREIKEIITAKMLRNSNLTIIKSTKVEIELSPCINKLVKLIFDFPKYRFPLDVGTVSYLIFDFIIELE